MSDYIASILRTIVPASWGALIAWVVTQVALPEVVAEFVASAAVSGFITAVAIGGWYALWRKIEPRVPAWLVTVVLGYAKPPTYTA